MSFSALILRNLFRQRVRTLLTVLGIAVGITTVVALGAITEGLRVTSGDFVNAGGADFMVAQDGASDLTFSSVPADDVDRIAALDDVERASGALIEVSQQSGNPYFLVFGYEPEALSDGPLELARGRLLAPGRRLGGDDRLELRVRARAGGRRDARGRPPRLRGRRRLRRGRQAPGRGRDRTPGDAPGGLAPAGRRHRDPRDGRARRGS